MFWDSELKDKPKFPNYRKLARQLVTYPKHALKLVDGGVRLPLGLQTNAWFRLTLV